MSKPVDVAEAISVEVSGPVPFKTKGVHHMAFVSRDMDETVRFYTGVMGFPLVVTLQLPPSDPFPGVVPGDLSGAKHYFFDIGNGDRLAFFWCPNEKLAPDFAKAGAGNHIAFAVDTIEELEAASRHLKENGIRVHAEIDHSFCRSIYFEDTNGITLEIAVYEQPWTAEYPFLQDENPVPAARALLGDKQRTLLRRFDQHGNAKVIYNENA